MSTSVRCSDCVGGLDGAGDTCPTCLGTGTVVVDHPDDAAPHETLATPDGLVLLPGYEPEEFDDAP